MKKQYTPEFKAQVMEEIQEKRRPWHRLQRIRCPSCAIESVEEGRHGDASLFVDERKAAKEQKVQEQKIERLYAQVGKFTTQLEWIKKIWHRSGAEMGALLW